MYLLLLKSWSITDALHKINRTFFPIVFMPSSFPSLLLKRFLFSFMFAALKQCTVRAWNICICVFNSKLKTSFSKERVDRWQNVCQCCWSEHHLTIWLCRKEYLSKTACLVSKELIYIFPHVGLLMQLSRDFTLFRTKKEPNLWL